MKEFKAESQKLLDLMINSIYTNHEVFLRELISNASDALDKVRLAQANEVTKECESLGIHLACDQEARTLTISDSGIGMDKLALETCLGTIAHSDSKNIKERIARQETSVDVDVIGQFGVGFYSAFMVASEISVISRAFGSDEAHQWKSDGTSGYSISPAKREHHGTDVVLRIRESNVDENFERYLDQASLQHLIKKYSNYIRYPITMDLSKESFDESGFLIRDETTVAREVVNTMKPLWTLDEQDVSEDDINELFRYEFQETDNPLRVIRARAKGAIEYDALLFIPRNAPGDLYQKDFSYGLKLYSSGVLIDQNFWDLLPDHFRFVRGIVDTNNINLNVSREMIQQDSRIQIISRQIERSITESLHDMIKNDRQEYEKVYHAFGTGLKYSICTSQGTLAEVLSPFLLYYSAQEKQLVTLQEYLDATENTKDTEVFYAVGNDIDRLAKSPNVVAVCERGHDVLLCPNGAQDELCFMLMGSYKGARFHSVTSTTLEVGSKEEDSTTQSGKDERILEALFKESPRLIIRVVASRYLRKPTQAASRVATEGLMTISMAKYLTTKHEKIDKPVYVLEVNTSHALFRIADKASKAGDKKTVKNCAEVLLGQALLVEDIPLEDPVAFNEATNELLFQSAHDETMRIA